MSAGCYLVQMSDGKNILIDSGAPANYTLPGGTPQSAPMPNVIEQLATLQVRPADIDILICTHFDVDHAGYHDAFTEAQFIVQQKHYELARSGHKRYEAARTHWDHPALHYQFVDGDSEIFPGLTLIETSGHAPGHQSVLVNLPQTGPVLLVIDAVAMQNLFTPDRPAWPFDDNVEQLRASTKKLLDLAANQHVALVIFGHDGQQWKTLKRAPDSYE